MLLVSVACQNTKKLSTAEAPRKATDAELVQAMQELKPLWKYE